MTLPTTWRLATIISVFIASTALGRAANPDLFKPDFLESILPQHLLYIAPPADPRAQGFDRALEHIRSVQHVDLVALNVKKGGVPPKPLKRPMPRPTTHADGDSTANLLMLLNSHGEVAAIYVVSTDNPDWATSCINAVAHWKFEPAKFNGAPVPALLCLPLYINFR